MRLILLTIFSLSFSGLHAIENVCSINALDSGVVKMSFNKYAEKFEYYLDMMKMEEEFTTSEYIEIVRIDNTMLQLMKNGDKRYRVNMHKEFLDYLSVYMNDIIKVLKADKNGCNGGHYSSKYKLCIGGTSPDKNSLINITD